MPCGPSAERSPPSHAGDGFKDIGDLITDRLAGRGCKPGEVAALLDRAWRNADPCGLRLTDVWDGPALRKPATIVSTRLHELDSALGGGLRTGGVHLLAAAPGNCKTQLAATVATNAARHQAPTAFFSMELSGPEVAQLIACQLSGVPRIPLALGKVGDCEIRSLRAMMKRHAGLPFWILDDDQWPGGLTRDDLRRLVSQGVKRFGWRLVVVDYLGLFRSPESDRSDYAADVLNSTALKQTAQHCDVALLVVAALRKPATGGRKEDARSRQVTLHDVAGAARLCYDAQTVVYIESKQAPSGVGKIRVRILKARFAPRVEDAEIVLSWAPRFGQITDYRPSGAPADTGDERA